MKKIIAITVLIILACAIPVRGESAPKLTSHVNDYAHLMSERGARQVANLLASHQRHTTAQIVVLTVPSTGGLSISEYSMLVCESWKLGAKGKDNGVLVLIAGNSVRIEVGRGLEEKIPDSVALKVIRENLIPYARVRKFDEGVLNVVKNLIAITTK